LIKWLSTGTGTGIWSLVLQTFAPAILEHFVTSKLGCQMSFGAQVFQPNEVKLSSRRLAAKLEINEIFYVLHAPQAIGRRCWPLG